MILGVAIAARTHPLRYGRKEWATRPWLFCCRGRRRFASRIQMVVVERGIEQKHETPLRFLAPHRIVGKEHDVAATERHVDDRWSARQFRASRQHAADPQIFLVSEAQDDTRIKRGRRKRAAEEHAVLWVDVKLLFRATPVRRRLRCRPSAALRDVRIGGGPTSAGTRRLLIWAVIPGNRDFEDRRLVEVHADGFIVAINDWALRVFNFGAEDRSARLKVVRLCDGDGIGQTKVHR
jgi:hypothetical protein